AADVGRAAGRRRRQAVAGPVAVRQRRERRSAARLRAARHRRRGQLAGARAVARAGVAAGRVRRAAVHGVRRSDRNVGAVAGGGADVARLTEPAAAGAAADAVDAEVAGQALAGRRARLAEALQLPAAAGLGIADVGRQAVLVAGAG